jgi:dolichol-phosphate mannosyltransferase
VPASPNRARAALLSLVIPTLNEAENITAFLRAVSDVLDAELPGQYELIVVDDNSVDGTWAVAAKAAEDVPAVRVVRRENETGLAGAVIRGWQVAGGEIVGTVNADFQHPPGVLRCMVRHLAGADLVIASRHVDGGGCGDWDIGRRIASRGAKLLGSLIVPEIFRLAKDPLSGCYFVRRSAIAGVEFRPVGYKTLIEILVRGRVSSIRECGYQMHRRRRGFSKVGLRQHVEYIQHLVRLRRELRRAP